jgi:hypothetical protein
MRAYKSLAVLAFAAAALGLAPVAADAQAAPGAAPAAPSAPALAVPTTGTTYRIYADTVTSGTDLHGMQGAPCVNQTMFFAGGSVVFRAVISDGVTGVALSAADIAQRGIKAVVTLSDGTTVPVTMKNHPPPPAAPVHMSYLSGSLFIKADHPTGSLPWTLAVTDSKGNTGTFTPVGQAAGVAVLTIVPKAPVAVK